MRFFFFPNDRCRGRRFLLPLLAMGAHHNGTSSEAEALSPIPASFSQGFTMAETKAYYDHANPVRRNGNMTGRIVAALRDKHSYDDVNGGGETDSPGILWLAGDSYMDAAYFARRNETAAAFDATDLAGTDPDAVGAEEADPFYEGILPYQLPDIVTHTNRALQKSQQVESPAKSKLWGANKKNIAARFVAVMAAQAGSWLRNRGNLELPEGERNMIPNDEVIRKQLRPQKDVIVAHVGGNDLYGGKRPILLELLQELLGPEVLDLLKEELPEGKAFVADFLVPRILPVFFKRVREINSESCVEEKSDTEDGAWRKKLWGTCKAVGSRCQEMTLHAAKKICERSYDFASQGAANLGFRHIRGKVVKFVVDTLTQKFGELYDKHLETWLKYLMKNGAPALTLLMPPPRPLGSFLLQFARSDEDPNGEGAVLPRIMAGLQMKPNMQKQVMETFAMVVNKANSAVERFRPVGGAIKKELSELVVLRSGERSPSAGSSSEISTSAGELSSEPSSRTTSASSSPQNSDVENFPEEAGPSETESAGSSPPAFEDLSSVKSELVAVHNHKLGSMISSATDKRTDLTKLAPALIETLMLTSKEMENASVAQFAQKLDEMKTALVLWAIQVYKPLAAAVNDPAAISIAAKYLVDEEKKNDVQNFLKPVISFFIRNEAQADKYTDTGVRLWAATVAGIKDFINANAGGETTSSSSQNNDLSAESFESLANRISANYSGEAFLNKLGWTAEEAKGKIVELAKVLPQVKHVAKAVLPKNLHTETLAAVLAGFLSDCLRLAQKPLQTKLENTIQMITTEHKKKGTALGDAKIVAITTTEALMGKAVLRASFNTAANPRAN
eukprot:g7502.t1